VSLDEASGSVPQALAEAAETVGFDASVLSVSKEARAPPPRLEFRVRIDGMTCSSCVSSVTNSLTALDGVETAQ